MTIRQVLVATDFSEPSEAALLYGRTLAAQFGATLHVVHVIPEIYPHMFDEGYALMTPEIRKQIEDSAREHLSELLIDSDSSGPPAMSAVLAGSSPARAIVEYAKDHAIDLIVIGTHGRGGVAHLMLGSVAERVVRLAACPVLTVRHPEHDFVRPDALVPRAGT
jgi:nucleotide-binding universal stress UspA family protein